MSNHSIKTIVGLAIIAIIGALQALHGVAGWGAYIDIFLPVLLVVEHGLNGNVQ